METSFNVELHCTEPLAVISLIGARTVQNSLSYSLFSPSGSERQKINLTERLDWLHTRG